MIQTLITAEPNRIQIMNFTEILCKVVKGTAICANCSQLLCSGKFNSEWSDASVVELKVCIVSKEVTSIEFN